jgi:hypothetical protein
MQFSTSFLEPWVYAASIHADSIPSFGDTQSWVPVVKFNVILFFLGGESRTYSNYACLAIFCDLESDR